MYAFDYVRPNTIAEAVKLAGEDEAKLLSGGMTLLPTLKQRLAAPSKLIDVARIPEMRGIKIAGNTATIGAATKHIEVATSAELAKVIPVLPKLASGIGDPQVRYRGTIGGSVANNDPAADYPAAVLGLNATVITNSRRIAGDDFFKGMFETALQPGEIITGFEFKAPKRAAYMKFRNPASRYAIVGVFVAETDAGVRVAVTGAGPVVFRQKDFEAALSKSFAPAALEGIKQSDKGLNGDIHASAEYRAHIVGVMAKRAVEAALA